MRELAPGAHALGGSKGGHVRAFLLEANGELTLVDTLFENDARGVLEAIRKLGRSPRDLKRIVLTHGHRSHLGGLAALKRETGATVLAHDWEADIIAGERRAQPVGLKPPAPFRTYPFQVGIFLGRPKHLPCPLDESVSGRRLRRPAPSAPHPRPLARPPGLPLGRKGPRDRRRRDRHLATVRGRLAGVQPQPRAAPESVRRCEPRREHRRRRPRRPDHTRMPPAGSAASRLSDGARGHELDQVPERVADEEPLAAADGTSRLDLAAVVGEPVPRTDRGRRPRARNGAARSRPRTHRRSRAARARPARPRP